jgi:hypothetical protein
MSLGPNFVSPFGGLADTGVDRSLLERALLDILPTSVGPERAATPVTLWIARSATLASGGRELVIPPHVILSFAPGAVLTLAAGVTIDVEGRLDAGTERRFALGVGAKVRFSGPLDEIHASWWDDGRSGGAPVRHALDVLWDRYARGREPAPVCLSGPYQLDAPVRVVPPLELAAPDAPPYAVVLRGRCHGASAPMTFRANSSATVDTLDALLSVEGKVILTLDHVGFDLTQLPEGFFSADVDALRLGGEYDRSRIEACTFRHGGKTGIHVTALWDAWREAFGDTARTGAGIGVAIGALLTATAMMTSVSRKAARLTISRCNFEGAAVTGLGIRINPMAPTMLSVSDCQFGGIFYNAITFTGSELSVFGCAFHNRAIPTGKHAEYIADIRLGVHGTLPSVLPGLPGVNAHLTVTHCRSTSETFLVGQPVFTAGDPGGALLTGVLHEPRTTASEDVATSIRWGVGYQARSLMLQGCEFWAPVRLGGRGTAGVVVELGTRFENLSGRPAYVGGDAGSVLRLPPPPTSPVMP